MKSPLEGVRSRLESFLPVLGLVALLVLGGCSENRSQPNIVLITVDTLRADRLHCYGYEISTAPAVDALARRGLLFENCTAHASSTAPALASLMTGLYPTEAGVLNNTRPLSRSVDTIALHLGRQGYRTAAFVSNFNLTSRMGFDRGFGVFDARLTEREQNRSFVPERTAEKTAAAAKAWLKGYGQEEPFFLWVHFQDPHGPYCPPDGFALPGERYAAGDQQLPLLDKNWGSGGIPSYQAIGTNRSTGFYRAMYDGEIAFFDRHLAGLMECLENGGYMEDTAVLFTADHGESMGEHGFWFSHEQDLFNELIRVPLIIAAPGIKPGRRTERVCHIDIFPTLAALAGESPEGAGTFRGRNIAAAPGGTMERPIYAETNFVAGRNMFRAVIVGRWKLIRSANKKMKPLLFDLHADPEEKKNLFLVKPDVAAKMMQILKTEEKRAASGGASVPLDLSPEDREALESLGYSGG